MWDRESYGPDWIQERPLAIAALLEWRKSIFTTTSFKNGNVKAHAEASQTIVEVLCSNNLVFNGFGQHTANDLCHLLCLHPFMPAILLCKDDTLFSRLQEVITFYVDTFWNSKEYFHYVCGNINSDHPFEFHYNSNKAFLTSYLLTYRKSQIAIRTPHWNFFVKSGLHDPKHIIGK